MQSFYVVMFSVFQMMHTRSELVGVEGVASYVLHQVLELSR